MNPVFYSIFLKPKKTNKLRPPQSNLLSIYNDKTSFEHYEVYKLKICVH